MKSEDRAPILAFDAAESWQAWLEENHATSRGIRLKFAKKASGIATMSPQEALEAALCYGWIDGKIEPFDDSFWLVNYTPRSSKSMWSKRNKEIAARLIADNRMQSAGLRAIEAAKSDHRWDQAYDSPKNMAVPDDFLKELAKNPKAEAFFATLNSANRYAIAWRLQTAKKPETRQRRMQKLLTMMANGERLH